MDFFLVSGNHLDIISPVCGWCNWLQKYGGFIYSFIPSFKNKQTFLPVK